MDYFDIKIQGLLSIFDNFIRKFILNLFSPYMVFTLALSPLTRFALPKFKSTCIMPHIYYRTLLVLYWRRNMWGHFIMSWRNVCGPVYTTFYLPIRTDTVCSRTTWTFGPSRNSPGLIPPHLSRTRSPHSTPRLTVLQGHRGPRCHHCYLDSHLPPVGSYFSRRPHWRCLLEPE